MRNRRFLIPILSLTTVLVSQVRQIAPKEERRVLNVRKRRFEGQGRVLGKAALLIESGERGVRALAVLGDIKAKGFIGLVNA